MLAGAATIIDGIAYNLYSDTHTAEVTSSGNYSGTIVIPSEVTYDNVKYVVTIIGVSAFYDCASLTSVTIGNSVTIIGERAFYGCTSLTSITIPNSVTDIRNYAFENCSGLTTVTIGNGVKSIHNSSFYNTGWYNNQNDGLLYLDGWLLGFKGSEPIGGISIKEGTRGIAEDAFSGCKGLTSVTIPNSVTIIGWYGFKNCTSLASVTFGNGLSSIGYQAFSGCKGLTSITIPNSVTRIEGYAFENCSGLTTVTIGNSASSFAQGVFTGCYRIHTIYCLNPTPPTCSFSTFSCSTSYVRDQYDVYTYATLHVPMGSKEVYASAHEWRYFTKIKEDMSAGGKVYYANLTVKQGETGYTRQPMKADESYTIYIGSLGGNKVNTVTFNGVDVTDQVANGYYTTPPIKEESELSISYEVNPSSVAAMSLNDVRVMGYQNEITVSNIDEPSTVTVFGADGKQVAVVPSALGNVTVPVESDRVYLVKVGTRTFKLAL